MKKWLMKDRRRAVVLPSLFTVANMGCGFFSILSASDGEFPRASWFILGAILLDMMDGRVARWVQGESSFGIEFDSMADWVSFGVAPGYMMYEFLLKDYGVWGYPIAFVYALCGALRLARFNLVALSGQGSKTHFTGLPIPAPAGLLASFVLMYSILEEGSSAKTLKILMDQLPLLYVLVPFIMLGLAFLMVSRVPYVALKTSDLKHPKVISVVVLGMSILFLIYPQSALFLFFAGYVISGIVRLMLRPLIKPEIPT
ncbi:MAG: CDP-diacylglycerol--serine O-phosphatidyltransferase [Elusimicrobia bacterium]|nr:CDP-diacylglycerol--serine O-phosphatidyltransferase [Elusimicrobiota bacterium]